MSEMHLKQPGLLTVHAVHLLRTRKRFKILCKQKILVISIETNEIKLVFSMT